MLNQPTVVQKILVDWSLISQKSKYEKFKLWMGSLYSIYVTSIQVEVQQEGAVNFMKCWMLSFWVN